MTLKATTWDVRDYIKTDERQLGYLEAAIEDGDPGLIAAALGDSAKARGGIAPIAEEIGLSRIGPYKAPSASGDPRLSTVLGVLKALNLELRIVAAGKDCLSPDATGQRSRQARTSAVNDL